MAFLKERGIETRPFFYPLHIMPPYKSKKNANLKTAEMVANRGINLPTFYDLKLEEIKYIAGCIKDFFANA